ncbi:MAG: hypothetical protein IKH54_00830 [Bacilli bacterium]|nr:hypothetical protein [Bacilli bacterium]
MALNKDLNIDEELKALDEKQMQEELNKKNSVFGVEKMIPCPKCGKPMKENARCCMHCGELNYLNEKNDSMKPIFSLGKKLKVKEDKIKEKEEAKRTKVDSKGRTANVRKYQFTKRITTLLVIVLLVVGAINYKTIIDVVTTFRAKSYIRQVDKMIKQVDEEVTIKCNSDEIINYSFEYSDDYFKTFTSLYTFNYFTGNIKITFDENGNKNYYVSITDGAYGFKDVLYKEDLDYKIVKKLKSSIDVPSHTTACIKNS